MRWGVGEGAAYGFEDTFEIVEDVSVPETKNSVSVLHKLGAAAIVCDFAKRMLASIEFDGELRLRARKIDEPTTNWALPPKFPRDEALTQGVPQ